MASRRRGQSRRAHFGSATYNVENLFDQKDDPANPFDQDEMTDEARLQNLAKTIRELDADILCLEEVESKECLLRFGTTT
jgi:endonuclease/exonuclease/phosphatase family metal-dependent hydrolase